MEHPTQLFKETIRAWRRSPDFLHFFAWIKLELKKTLRIEFDNECSEPSKEAIDVIMPTVSKDYDLLELSTASLKNICHPVNKVFIVSDDNDDIKAFCRSHGFYFVNEKDVLGYGKERIEYNPKGLNRSGWLYQQLLKLAGDRIAEKDNYLVLDSDTVLINKHSFIEEGRFIFAQSSDEYHQPYFKAFRHLFKHPAPSKVSATCHMMIFNKQILKEMKDEIETNTGLSWDKAIISTKDYDESQKSCFCEYETYFNWILYQYPKLAGKRPFYNKGLSRKHLDTLENLHKNYGDAYNSLSFHNYLTD